MADRQPGHEIHYSWGVEVGAAGPAQPRGTASTPQDQPLQDQGYHQASPVVLTLPAAEGLAGPAKEGAVLAMPGVYFMVKDVGDLGPRCSPLSTPFSPKLAGALAFPAFRGNDEIHAISGPSPEALPSFDF